MDLTRRITGVKKKVVDTEYEVKKKSDQGKDYASYTDLYKGMKNMYSISKQVVGNSTVMSMIASYLFGSNVVVLYSLSSKAYEWYNSWHTPKYSVE